MVEKCLPRLSLNSPHLQNNDGFLCWRETVLHNERMERCIFMDVIARGGI